MRYEHTSSVQSCTHFCVEIEFFRVRAEYKTTDTYALYYREYVIQLYGGKFQYYTCYLHERQEPKRFKPLIRRAKYLALRLTHLLAQTQRRCNRLELSARPLVSSFAGVV